MSFSLIVAMSENRVIGKNNQLPWHLPNDLKHFKAITMGKIIIMGRKTYESIGRVLPGRPNIILSSNLEYLVPGGEVVHDIKALMALEADSDSEKMIIGGAMLYEDFLNKVDTIYLTKIHAVVEGDTFFPVLSNDWIEVETETQHFEATSENPFAYSFMVLRKKI